MYQFNRKEYEERMKWYQDARFGMFIHWGLYSIPARGEWVRSTEEMPEEEYLPFMKEFDARDYNPKQWAKEAKAAGMKYVVLTAKHHDGFCLFDSKYTDYKVTNTPAGRDLIKEYVEALREEGLKVGLYFTLLDWHHPDYPHYGDRIHPMRNHPECSNENRDFSRYIEYMYNQVEEVCTNYGKIDIMWFDFSYDDMRGEKWGATRLIDMVRRLQPGIIIDNRLEVSGEGRGSLYECDPTPYHGDFISPEQIIPPEGICDKEGTCCRRPFPALPSSAEFRLFRGACQAMPTASARQWCFPDGRPPRRCFLCDPRLRISHPLLPVPRRRRCHPAERPRRPPAVH